MWFDYSHFAFRDLPMEQMVRQSLPITAGVAVKDAAEVDGRVTFALPGQAGTIDYGKVAEVVVCRRLSRRHLGRSQLGGLETIGLQCASRATILLRSPVSSLSRRRSTAAVTLMS